MVNGKETKMFGRQTKTELLTKITELEAEVKKKDATIKKLTSASKKPKRKDATLQPRAEGDYESIGKAIGKLIVTKAQKKHK